MGRMQIKNTIAEINTNQTGFSINFDHWTSSSLQ